MSIDFNTKLVFKMDYLYIKNTAFFLTLFIVFILYVNIDAQGKLLNVFLRCKKIKVSQFL